MSAKNLYWSKAHNLLHHGSKDLEHFPENLFQFGKAKRDISLSKRERRRLGIGISLPSINNNSSNRGKRVFGIGSHRLRGATRHSDPIHLATLNGEHSFMQMLIKGNAVKDIDARDGNMATCLHIAVEKNDIVAVRILVEAGAALSLNDYETPLHAAVRMDHTDIVRFLIRAGASLETNNTQSKNVMDISLRKVLMNDKFANGVLRPITVQKEELDYDGTKKNNNKRSKKSKKQKKVKIEVQQLYEKMTTMASWDHGQQLLHDASLHQKKRKNAQKLSRLILKEDLSNAKALIGNFGASANQPDPYDFDRSAVTYAAMYANPSTVEWLVKDTGARPTTQDGRTAEQYGRNKSATFLQNWPTQFQSELEEQQKRTLLEYEKATELRSQEANAKQSLSFLRKFLSEGRVRHGHRFRERLIRAFRHLEKCPLGPADDFVELGRILRDLLPHSWKKEVWTAFQDATIAARSKENMTKTFGGNIGGGSTLHKLSQQGHQGEVFKRPGERWSSNRTGKRRTRIPPPPRRDYSNLVTGPRHAVEYVPGI